MERKRNLLSRIASSRLTPLILSVVTLPLEIHYQYYIPVCVFDSVRICEGERLKDYQLVAVNHTTKYLCPPKENLRLVSERFLFGNSEKERTYKFLLKPLPNHLPVVE
jgi:hypothetical protein